MDRRGCVIYVNTFSHSLAPSMRMGYMVLPERLMEQYRQTLGFLFLLCTAVRPVRSGPLYLAGLF